MTSGSRLLRAYDGVSQSAAAVAALLCAWSALQPWGQATLFGHVTLELPGVIYRDGAVVLGACGIALALRRWRLVGIAAGLAVAWAAGDAAQVVPREIIKQLAATQSSLFPINRLLDQANIPDIMVGNLSQPHAAYLAAALLALPTYGYALAAAAAIGLPRDPLLLASWRRFGFRVCRACRWRIPVRRSGVEYCPHCGAWQDGRRPEPRRCAGCRLVLAPLDAFCTHCGLVALADAPALPTPPARERRAALPPGRRSR